LSRNFRRESALEHERTDAFEIWVEISFDGTRVLVLEGSNMINPPILEACQKEEFPRLSEVEP
jgi:hypothetical protein